MKKFPLVQLTAFAVAVLSAQDSSVAASEAWNMAGDGSWVTDANWNGNAAAVPSNGSSHLTIAKGGIIGVSASGNTTNLNINGGNTSPVALVSAP